MRWLVFAIGAVVALGGCTAGANAPIPNGWIVSPSARVEPGPQHAERPPLLTSTQIKGLTSLPWKVVAVNLATNQVDLTYAAGGGCTTFRGLYLDESPAAVTIGVFGLTKLVPIAGQPGVAACPANLVLGLGIIDLKRALGSRHLVHLQVDRFWQNALS